MKKTLLPAFAFTVCALAMAAPNSHAASRVALEGQSSAQTEFRSASFEFTRGGPLPVHWKIELRPDGSGTFSGVASSNGPTAPQTIHVAMPEQNAVFAVFPIVQSKTCETKLKHIANTGAKTLTLQAADGATSSCTFNYSDSESLNTVADTFIAIAETMQAGDRLAQKHRYDRLGLDAEIEALAAEVKSGRAKDVMNIAPVLQSIADDERLMERVQRKATRLLQDAGASAPADSAR